MGKTIDQLEWIYRKAVRSKEQSISFNSDNPPSHVGEKKGDYGTNLQLVEHIHTFIKSKGFFYSKKDVVNLFLSLRSKPFVILSGISGTGKTKIVQWFAESLGATEMNGQFKLIPVRPDWNDGSDLLGYVDIKGDFKKGPLTEILIQANENLNIPYFVLLDEMNLARVEYYFSDILSVMESQRWQDGKLVTSKLLPKEITGDDEDIRIPPNLYIIGTVNMDETTHPFSKKVLDRANTIEFNNIELSNLSFLEELEEVEPVWIFHDKISSKYIHLKDVYSDYSNLVRTATEELERINEALEKMNAQVGYRVRDEICFYLVYNHQDKLLDYNEAFDYCILQKILPRITGSDSRVEKLLKQLYLLFTSKEFVDGDSYDEVINNAKYPNSARKVIEMLRGLQDGFTSFWIS
ncbi:AAA family ATPase [Bacillus enclensis]|nr:AAA family ATPase [[Bacillus] enclensis]